MTSAGGGHGRTRRLLLAAPGFVTPAALLVLCIQWFVDESQYYYSLPLPERMADGDPLSADAGMFVAGVGIVCLVLLLLPPLLAALPRRLRIWQAVLALVMQALPLLIAWDAAIGGSMRGWLAFLGFVYVPILVIIRLVLGPRAAASVKSTSEASG
jgi:hypothetical protein